MQDIETQVTQALEHPEIVLKRLALYETAEQKQRHVEYELSILRYALAGYIGACLEDSADLDVAVFDSEVEITGTNAEGTTIDVSILYPAWLMDFFDSEENFNLLVPESDVPLAEVLVRMRDSLPADLREKVDLDREPVLYLSDAEDD